MHAFSIEPWLGWALLSAICAALTAVLAKLGLQQVDSDFAQLIRTAVVLALTVLLVSVTGKWHQWQTIPAKAWLFLLLSGLATGASWLCYFRALSTGDVSRVAPIDKLSVVFVAIFAALVLGEHLGLKGWIGVGLILSGAVLLVFPK